MLYQTVLTRRRLTSDGSLTFTLHSQPVQETVERRERHVSEAHAPFSSGDLFNKPGWSAKAAFTS